MNYVLPAFRSSFSLLYGTASPEKIVQHANQYDYRAFLLADNNNLYGCYDTYYAALDLNIKPIIGVILTTKIGELTLICQNHQGFKNLSRLVTEYQLETPPSVETIKKYKDNIICLISKTEHANKLKSIFGDKFYIQIGDNNPAKTYRFAQKYKFKTAACPQISFLQKNDYKTHRLLCAIKEGDILENISDSKTADKEEFLKEQEWYNKFYDSFPKAIDGSREIIEQSLLKFPERKNILPNIQIDSNHLEQLKRDAISGLKKRVSDPSGFYFARLEYELSVIKKTGFIDYFLIVGDIVRYCRRQNIAAVGRGSAAGSLVSYSLGITEVDPIKENLYFERFLNEARSDCPDIDLDIDWRYRDDVLDYVYKKYGREHVAMMATYTHFRPRMAVRETAKAYGLSPDEINVLTKSLPRMVMGHQTNKFDTIISETAKEIGDEKCQIILQMAQKLNGLPRHLGIHSGGIVITPEPLTDYIPLEQATKGIVITQCDMYQAEKIGLVKIDILGQRGLAVIADCYKEVRKIKGANFAIPQNDKKTFKLLQSGKTIGVFQIESPGLRALLQDLAPKELNDITLALALIRPGASESGMKKIFLNRFHGKEITKYPHQKLSKILKETFGVFIYQEQVILAAQNIAGFNLPASDLLRRAITKKRKKREKKKLEKRFLDGARKNGVARNTAVNILKQLRQFAAFGFCKAHAATYGFLALQSAYFKTHYPDVFLTAVLRNGGGYYRAAVYVAEARRLGITVLPPDINHSEKRDLLHSHKIYLGLNRVRDINYEVLNQAEQNRPFSSLADFISRINISEHETEQLIRVGFFDSLETSRAKLFWMYRLSGHKGKRRKSDLFGNDVLAPKMKTLPSLRQFNRYDIFKAEKDILKLSASFHPLTLFSNYINIDLNNLFMQPDKSAISISGWRADIKRIKTKHNQWMVFLTFETLDDTFEVILFPDTYNRYAKIIRSYRYLRVEGILNREEGTPVIVANKISPAPTGLKEVKWI
ncbi:MAG: DNA polymerase III subunit alpha [candidate division Zixibacteria bacterium]|nr:DNA polymerase III subunit alpha [candidate division Zixibacteria bacterium]